MDEKSHNQNATGLTARQQRLLLRAVVGSLVLSAALASSTPAHQSESPGAGGAQQPSPRVDPWPFYDLLAHARRLAAAGKIKPDDSFTFTVEAARNPDGTLSGARLRVVEAGGPASAHWHSLTDRFVLILSNSRALAYLEGIERVTLTVSLGERFAAELAADDASASRHANTLGVLLALARDSQQGRPGVEVLNNMRASASGKRLLLKLDMSRAEVGNLLSTTRAIP